MVVVGGVLSSSPAAADHQGRIVFVNGRPGSNVEVCMNGSEVKSSLRYGQHAARLTGAGTKTLKFRKSSRGTCRGDVLGQTSVSLSVGGDWVVLLTRHTPDKVLVWDAAQAFGSPVVIRHGADLGTVGFKWTRAENGQPWFPAADAPYIKGQFGYGGQENIAYVFWAHQPPAQTPIAGPITFTTSTDRRTEGILIGTSLANARFKLFSVPELIP
jgi:hypothetical protein